MVHSSWKSSTMRVGGLLLALATLSYAAAGSASLGTLRIDGSVYVGGEKASAETALFSGDRITTSDGHATVSLSSGHRVVMDRDSSAALTSSTGSITLGIEKGRLALLSNPKSALQVETDGLRLSPSSTFPTLAEISMLKDGSLTIAVHKGAILVQDLRAEPVEVAAGRIITISPRLGQQTEPQGQPIGTGAHGKKTLGEKLRTFHFGHLSHAASAAIVGGALVGGTAAAIIVTQTGEESSPATP